jgi:hypothetical protein
MRLAMWWADGFGVQTSKEEVMRKRKAGRAGKRNAVKDLSARRARKVVGGLLPAVRSSQRATPGQTSLPTESWSLHYDKIQI